MDRGQQVVADRLGDPRVDAVGDDEVEVAELPAAQVGDVALAQLDVLDADRRDRLPALRDRGLREVDAERGDPGRGHRHREQVPAGAAADLQDPRRERVRGVQPVQDRHRSEPVRVGLSIRIIGVSDGVVNEVGHRSCIFHTTRSNDVRVGPC